MDYETYFADAQTDEAKAEDRLCNILISVVLGTVGILTTICQII